MCTPSDREVDRYLGDVKSAQDYYPFGMQMPGRAYFPSASYRYAFNGKETDFEMYSLSTLDYGFRIYNPAVGKFLSVDPISNEYPWYTPYQFAGNKPTWCIDLDGLEEALPRTFANGTLLSHNSESTCIGCAEQASRLAMEKRASQLKKLKGDFDQWRRRPENFGKPIPPQFQKVASDANRPVTTISAGGVEGSRDFKLFKANYDTYGQYLPGPSDIVDGLTALDELTKGNYKAAAAAGFFLLPGADVFKPIKALRGVGGELLEKYVQKFANQSKHLTKLDVQGALKDIAGNPVIINGKTFNHLKEVTEALNGVGNQLDKLGKDIDAGRFTGQVLEQANIIRSTLQKQKDKLTNLLNTAKQAAAKNGG